MDVDVRAVQAGFRSAGTVVMTTTTVVVGVGGGGGGGADALCRCQVHNGRPHYSTEGGGQGGGHLYFIVETAAAASPSEVWCKRQCFAVCRIGRKKGKDEERCEVEGGGGGGRAVHWRSTPMHRVLSQLFHWRLSQANAWANGAGGAGFLEPIVEQSRELGEEEQDGAVVVRLVLDAEDLSGSEGQVPSALLPLYSFSCMLMHMPLVWACRSPMRSNGCSAWRPMGPGCSACWCVLDQRVAACADWCTACASVAIPTAAC